MNVPKLFYKPRKKLFFCCLTILLFLIFPFEKIHAQLKSFSEPKIITTSADAAGSVFAIDMDGDGDMDVLSASYYDNKIAWYENDGNENFTAHTITTSASGARSVFAIDMDGDGDIDVLSASSSDNKIAWYENDGNENFTTHTITSSANAAYSVFAIDIDGDGDIDVLSASSADYKIAWYENDGNENFTAHTISSSAYLALSVFAIDVDGDGDIDVLSASDIDKKIVWYENDGNENFTAHTITTSASGARSVFAIDMDGDGDIDVLSASYGDNKIAWYENDGNENFTTHTITTSARAAYSVFAIDVDGDGDIDVLSASYGERKIVWYENDGNESFTTHTITTSADGAHSVFAIDMDGDGNIDVLSASMVDDKIAWYEFTNTTFSGGTGTTSDPYKIANPIDLNNMREALTASFVVTADIDLNTAPYNTGEGWDPIGTNGSGKEFEGVFDGNGFTIKNLFINRPSENFVGLFGTIIDGVVKNVALEDVSITGGNYTGALVGLNYSDVQGSYATGTVTGVDQLGGLVGMLENDSGSTAEITNSYSLVNVTSTGINFGGLLGRLKTGTVNSSYAAGSVSGGTSSIGGLIGSVASGTVTNSYWDIQITTQASSDGGTGLTTAQMKQSSNFSGFDFSSDWNSIDGSSYPYLRAFGYKKVGITGNEGWRMLSTPVLGTSFGTLLEPLWTQGFTGADVSTGASNLYTWNEATKAFQPIGNATDIPAAGTGFITYVYADDDADGTQEGFPKTLTNSGTQFTGTASPTLTFTSSDTLANDGWNLVGNPYGTTIDWDATTGMTSTNLDASFYIWSDSASGGAGAYLSWNGSTGTFGGGEIATWQGFWVKANAASPVISLNDKIRSRGGILRKKAPVSQLVFTLKDGTLSSKTILMFNDNALLEKDHLDAYKLQSLNVDYLSLFTKLNDGSGLDINALPLNLENALDMPLGMDGADLSGNFELSWNPSSLPDGFDIVLIDTETKTEFNLNEASTYNFRIENQAKSKIVESKSLTTPRHAVFSPKVMKAKATGSRFTIQISSKNSVSNEPIADLPQTVELEQNYPNPFNPSTVISYQLPVNSKIQLQVFDVLGRQVAQLVNGQVEAGYHQVTFDARNLASGMYIYRLQTGNSVTTKKLTLIK